MHQEDSLLAWFGLSGRFHDSTCKWREQILALFNMQKLTQTSDVICLTWHELVAFTSNVGLEETIGDCHVMHFEVLLESNDHLFNVILGFTKDESIIHIQQKENTITHIQTWILIVRFSPAVSSTVVMSLCNWCPDSSSPYKLFFSFHTGGEHRSPRQA